MNSKAISYCGPRFGMLALASFGTALFALSTGAQVTTSTAAATMLKAPTYDVVLIKPDKSASGMVRVNINDDTFAAQNVTLKMLIGEGYGIKQDLIFGLPGWADSTHFDLTAKIVDPDPAALKKLTEPQRQQMMRPVLVDRFKLQAHSETRVLPVYDLVVAKSGSKLKQSAEELPSGKDGEGHRGGMMRVQNTVMTATAIKVSGLADMLARRLHRTVIDKTGLAGKFDFELNWTPPEGGDNSTEAADAALFTALQEQLGLKLESSKGPVETLVVDHVEMPVTD